MKNLATAFAHAIVQWQHTHGRHGLPWQHQSAYATWISEIMLQQTQVKTVLEYYIRFMARFPTIIELAQSELDDVLALWAGLGYYSRARNLHQAARIMHAQYQGQLPQSLDALVRLPGIGPSTAGAILAMGHRQYGVILDGNVKRVLSRCFGVHGNLQNQRLNRQLWQISTWVTPQLDCATYTQGIMDLGAQICTKHQPLCQQCPCQDICYAKKAHLTASLPYPKFKKQHPVFNKVMCIPYHKGQVGLNRRPQQGIWGGLWTPMISNEMNNTAPILKTYPVLKHVFTHQTWLLSPVVLDGKHIEVDDWFSLEDALQLGIPKPVKSILELIQHENHLLQKTQS